MKKFFRKLTGSTVDASGRSGSDRRSSGREAAQKELADLQAQMQSYKGQRYNPAEDDGITTEGLFSVVDGDSGQAMDVRELLGVTEEELRAAGPEILAAMAHMNRIKPISEQPRIEEEKKEEGDGQLDQKARHFKYFNVLDTLPVARNAEGANAGASSAARLDTDGGEHVVEMNAEGAYTNVIAWDNWWQMKE